MAATDHLIARSDDGSVRLQQSGGASSGGSVERKDQRLDSMNLRPMEAQPVHMGKQKAKKDNEISRSDCFDGLDFGDVMLDQAFNAAL